MGNRSPGRGLRWAGLAVATLLAAVLVEGAASWLVALLEATAAERTYQAYDPAFGWVNLPDLDRPDFFGPGRRLRTNGRGFRSDDEVPAGVPPGKRRVVCLGNSFTFGQGVGNDETWCRLLEGRVPDLVSVNLGQAGYGVDQAYLWYRHAGEGLEHEALVFGLIAGDFERMAGTASWNAGKPVLRLDGAELVPHNVPVPRVRHWLARKSESADLRSVRLLRAIGERLFGPPELANVDPSNPELARVARAVLQRVARDNARIGRRTLFVYLPTEIDLRRDQAWRTWVRDELREIGAELLDLTPDMRALPAGRTAGFFLTEGPDKSHYDEEGNRWVAELVAARLAEPGRTE